MTSGQSAPSSPGALQNAAHQPLRSAVLVSAVWVIVAVVATALSLLAQTTLIDQQRSVVPEIVVPAVLFAAASFLLRFLRWHLLARRVAPDLGLAASFEVGTIGFGLIMTPARAGEALKLFLLRQQLGVPVATSTPAFLMEKISEGIGLALLALLASFFLPMPGDADLGHRLALLGVTLLVLGLVVSYRHRVLVAVPALPLFHRLIERPSVAHIWADLAEGTERVVAWSALLPALGLSVLARTCDGAVMYLTARLFGIDLPFAAACFIIGGSGFLGGISMMPGGAGVVESTQVGLLLLFGAEPAAALATTLTARLLILWLWVLLGLGLALRYVVHPWQPPPKGPL